MTCYVCISLTYGKAYTDNTYH